MRHKNHKNLLLDIAIKVHIVEILATILRWLVKPFDINLLSDFQFIQDNSPLNL